MSGRRRAGTALSCALLLAVAGLLTLQITQPWSASSAAKPWPRPRAGDSPRVELGVTTAALARDSAQPWRTADLEGVNAFEQDARRHADIVMWFADWAHVADFDTKQAAAVAARGSVPEITWEPWDSTGALGAPQPRFQLIDIINGAHDTYIKRWAREIAAYKQPVLLRFAQEMNGRSYPWSESINGNRPGQYAAAWNHVHAIFDRAAASNVSWVWSPVAGRIQAEQYPGADAVDILGLSGFVADKSVFGSPWRSFATVFDPPLDTLHALAPDKPVSLTEIAVAQTGGDKAAWITGMFDDIQRRPYLRSIVWFNLRKEADWRIESSPAAQKAFAAGLSRVAQ
jgi:Glycosyl hydrolase family 26